MASRYSGGLQGRGRWELPQTRLQEGGLAAVREETVSGEVGFGEAVGIPYEKLKPGPGKGAVDVARHQRRRIHSAMVKTVAERGYGAVTVRELARVAGVSTRTFYRHYPSKEECFLRVHQLIVRRVLRGIQS